MLYFLIITLQEQIYHFWYWLAHADPTDKSLDADGVHKKALMFWKDLKKQNANISMPGALVGAFAVIVQTLPSNREKPERIVQDDPCASSSASSSGENPETKAKKEAWAKFDKIVYTKLCSLW